MARQERGCGSRKVGGLYLFFDLSNTSNCQNLPLPLPKICPCCGEGIVQARGLKYIQPRKLLPVIKTPCQNPGCPVCSPPDQESGLMWVGQMYYTAKQFIDEAVKMGISKRIAANPKKLKPGDWVYFVHPAAIRTGTAVFDEDEAPRHSTHSHTEPGIFLASRLTEVQKIIKEEDTNNADLIKKLEDQGIVPVVEYDEQKPEPEPVTITNHVTIKDDTPRDIREQLPGRGTCTRCGNLFGFSPKDAKNPRYCPDCKKIMDNREDSTKAAEPKTKKKSKKTKRTKTNQVKL